MKSCMLREHLQRMFFYDRWANDHVFEVLAALPDPPERDVQRMAHVVAALGLWRSRVSGEGNPSVNLMRPGWSIAEARSRLLDVHDAWSRILSGLGDDDLRRKIEWERTEGGRFQALLRDIATQLPLHGSYHRGQLSITLKDELPGPLDIDYIFTTWEPAAAPSIA